MAGEADETELTRLVMVRHGEAIAAVEGRVGGHDGCTGLSDLGRQQAELLRDRFASTGFQPDVVVTSVLARAVETTEILATGVGHDPVEVPQRCELCEMHPGEGDGLAWEVFRERYGSTDLLANPERPLSPGGETIREFSGRVQGALRRLEDDHTGQTALVVCHGGVIMAAAVAFLGLQPRWFFHDLANTSITEWVRQGDGQWLLGRFNDAAHLESL